MLNIASTLTEHDLEERKGYITATDVAKLMGTSPEGWGSPGDVWIDKCCEVEPIKPNAAMLWGSLLEDDIITYAEAKLRQHFGDDTITANKVGTRRKHKNGVMSASLDAVLRGGPFNGKWSIEAKTHASIHPNVNMDEWGDDDFTDEIPPYYLDQVLAQIACAELDGVYVVLCVGMQAPTIYMVERAKHLDRIAQIENTCCDFWDNHILTRTPPADFHPRLETVKRLKVTNTGAQVSIPDAPVERIKRLNALKNRCEKSKKQIEALVLMAMKGSNSARAVTPKGHTVFLGDINVGSKTVAGYSYQRMYIDLAGKV